MISYRYTIVARAARRLAPSLLALGLSLSALSGHALAQASWSDQFDRPGLLGRIFALGTWQGQLVAGGLGVQGDGHTSLGLVARFDGTHWQPLPNGPGSGSPNQVRALHEHQGDLIVGGSFPTAGGVLVNDVARWDGSQWHPIGGGVDGVVWSLATYRGDLIVGGEFPTAGGVTVNGIAAWNGSQWRALGSGMPQGVVRALLAGPDDRLYAAGTFESAGGATVHHVAVWDGDAWSGLGGGFPSFPLNATVWDLAFHAGSLYACANTDMVPGGANHEKVARFTGSSWVGAGNFPDSSIGTTVYALLSTGSELYAAGNFSEADGAFADKIARFDGSTWGFVGGVSGSVLTTTIFDLELLQGRIVVGGEFSQAGFSFAPGQPVVTESVASYDGTAWHSVGTGLGLNGGSRDAVLWNGEPAIAGGFTEAGSQAVAGLIHFDGADWRSLGTFSGGQVDGLAVIGGDLIAGGEFSSVDGLPIFGVARWDGSSWSGFGSGTYGSALAEYQGQIYAGGLGGVKRWNGTTWESFADQLFGFVQDLHVHAGVLYIGGTMYGAGHIVSWDGSTQQTVGGSGANAPVLAFHSFGGELLVGGEFTQIGGVAAHNLARWDGSAFHPFGNLTGTQVDSMATFQGELYAGGNLFVPGLPPEKYLARWDGSGWRPLGSGLEGYVGTLVPDEARGHLWVTGLFQSAGGVPSWHVGRWEVAPPELGTRYCIAAPNSAGPGARMHAEGSAEVSRNLLTLSADGLPPLVPGLFYFGASSIELPFGNGYRCVGGATARLRPPTNADASGFALRQVDLTAPPAAGTIVPGAELSFQLWYRDPMGGGAAFNLTDAIRISFE